MVWFLPFIVFGGLFMPLVGYLVFFMMIFFLILSYFKGRYWCGHLCPRGAFLDLVLSRVSLEKKIPSLFLRPQYKWLFFSLFMAFFFFQLATAAKNLYAIGFVFVRMCIITTILAIILGLRFRPRTWCAMCPMGLAQTKISTLRRYGSCKSATYAGTSKKP